jgi:alkanesulfonate monooxygenase SsuD/methylene tetrahydromethanopterin reductase-like flavin-dependent oxidoreductase (luciferase family)
VDLDPSWSWPKPIQKPHPPIVLGGGAGPKTFGDIAEFCDGWMPISGRHEFETKVDALHDAVRSVGRDPASISLGVFGARSTPDGGALSSLAAAGVTRAVLPLSSGSPGEVLAELDALAPLIDTLKDA